MKYKVGDKVKIRSDLKVGDYGIEFVVPPMLSFRGKIVTISDVYSKGYHIEKSLYNWTDEMFESSEIKIVSNEINDKGENMLESLNLVDLYYNNKIEKLKEMNNDKIKEIRESSSIATEYQKLVDNFKKSMDKLYMSQFSKEEKSLVNDGKAEYSDFDVELKKSAYSLSVPYFIDSNFNTDEILEIQSNEGKKISKLKESQKTVKAHVAIAKTKEEVEEILKRYGILTEDGKLAINEDN